MNNKAILGIDTSNYTTSGAIMSIDGELIANIKCPLPVAAGERGLRQSEAVFAHIKNMPSLMAEVGEALQGYALVALGASARPRNIEGSYMPCFLSGVASAESIANSMHIPLFRYSHQCGHVMAALYSSKRFDLLDGREFCAFHVSGGTTEMLKVSYLEKGFSAELVGGTKDLNAGQIIDRVGVYMGLPFPAGPHIERLALENNKKIPPKKPKLSEGYVNLSGLENMAKKLYDETGDKCLTSAFVLEYIGDALALLAENYESIYGRGSIVFAGGVMCNSIIKNKLSKMFDASFAEPMMSADNAVGTAYLALLEYNSCK
jgi:N6-L-threonylcarbamoyladenine synthase